MKKKIAVIGAGIIGLYIDSKLEEKGFNVTVFEKKNIEKWAKIIQFTHCPKRIFFYYVENDLIENTIKKMFKII